MFETDKIYKNPLNIIETDDLKYTTRIQKTRDFNYLER